ncbi:O-antigen ligase family protein [Marinobacter sp. chi1]|uniref:O-antigen ligase family protein n=1 Tax=Marinobacter suaedae TaxID=3057675 RepID=A0ABT8W2X0_9GAMM|nr:O-antigen ligase family protein [Marinobacter sp. chi1]MDO3722582.1 O-antigen ligase family protein [Marinobacter sp. chi1]
MANSLLQPQYIWPWAFEGIPIFNITAALSILGLAIFHLSYSSGYDNGEDINVYNRPQNLMIIFIWGWTHISHHLSPFKGGVAFTSPEIVLSTLNAIVIMYFVILGLCKREKTLLYLCYIFIGVGVFYIYWANKAYFGQQWFMFENGRLNGPSRSPYRDGNALSVLIVMCMPFLIFMIFRVNRLWLKILMVLVVPLSWHAIVLFSSRGALLASVVTLLIVSSIIRSTKLNLLIGTCFVLFVAYQGATLLDRTTQTVDLAQQSDEEPINPRLVSWGVGLKIVSVYPIFGAGVQMFQAASQSLFPGESPHVAHNTFLNFAANTGLPNGLLFLALIWLSWSRLLYARKLNMSFDNSDYYALVCSSVSVLGFFVCSIFLDLIIFEPFYIALIINLISYIRVRSQFQEKKG